MDIKTIRELTRLMRDNELIELEVESADLKVKLKKASQLAPVYVQPAPLHAPTHAVPAIGMPNVGPAVDEFANCRKIISPIPGTVYLKPNPDTPNFVNVGTQIDEGKVVCLIEAMKVFNEIKAEAGIKGTIRKVLVQDGQAVEYGTVLFLVG